jgi:hypothetical protein
VTEDGGQGDDLAVLMVSGATGNLSASVRGGAGRDVIDVEVDLSAINAETGRISVAVDGSSGGDNLTLLARGAESNPANTSFTLDGGAGDDFALVSAFVRVRNVENVRVE